MKVTGYSDIGTRRTSNQDTFWSAVFEADGQEYGILVMCDGMGGLSEGTWASKEVTNAIRNSVLGGKFSIDELKETMISSSKVLLDRSIELSEGSNKTVKIGTTCTVVLVSKATMRYECLHIGDSRLYLIGGIEGASMVTEDHTHINVLAKRGVEITPELRKKYRSVLSRCIGTKLRPNIDYISGPIYAGQKLLVCSDGFWHHWDGSVEDLQSSIERVKNLGELDNITVALLDMEG